MSVAQDPAQLHPPLEPFDSGRLNVSDGHVLYYEQCGRPDGVPLVFLHGGPGSGCSPRHRQLFDPAYRAVLFDQRGCGRSRPRGAVQANTSAHLLGDIERLRRHLGITRWLVVGGSWGGGLALAYAAEHPTACAGLLLRAPFLGRREDLDWFFRDARQFAPDAWDALARQAPTAAHADLLAWLHAGVHDGAPAPARACALAWQAWEWALLQEPGPAPAPADAGALIDKYRVQSHYLVNGCFWGERPLLTRAATLGRVPGIILQGRHDLICRPLGAWDVYAAWPGSRLRWVEGCGHSPYEPAMVAALARALRELAGEDAP